MSLRSNSICDKNRQKGIAWSHCECFTGMSYMAFKDNSPLNWSPLYFVEYKLHLTVNIVIMKIADFRWSATSSSRRAPWRPSRWRNRSAAASRGRGASWRARPPRRARRAGAARGARPPPPAARSSGAERSESSLKPVWKQALRTLKALWLNWGPAAEVREDPTVILNHNW